MTLQVGYLIYIRTLQAGSFYGCYAMTGKGAVYGRIFLLRFMLLGKITGCGIYGNFCPASRYKLSYHALNAKIYLQE
ncbi:MAG: hypothetical protein ACKOBL_06755 [Chloroflexota bacterium]|jgi:hypothetical protein